MQKFILILCMILFLSENIFSQDCTLSVRQARECFNTSKYLEASKLLETCVFSDRKGHNIDDTTFINILRMYGDCLRYTKQFEKAIQIIEELRIIYRETTSANDLMYAEIAGKLADCYYNTGDFKSALPLYEKVKKIRFEQLGVIDTLYAQSLSDLATVHYVMGNYTTAFPLFENALTINKEVRGKQNAQYAEDLGNLAMTYKSMGNYSDALPLLEESCSIYKQLFGLRNLEYASSISKLAGLYVTTGNYTAALPLYEEVKSIRLEMLGAKDTEYARALNNLGFLYVRMGDLEAALPFYLEAKNIRKETLGDRHPDYAISLNNLASLYSRIGKYQEAIPLFEESSQIIKDRKGVKHPDYATSLNNIALLYSEIGNYEAALPLQNQATSIDKEILGIKSTNYASDLINLVNMNSAMGNNEAALPLSKEASDIYREVSGSKHPDYALSLNSLARLHNAMGNYKAALPLLIEAASIYKESLGSNHIDYGVSLKNLAITYKELGDYNSALPLIENATSIYKEALGIKHPDYAASLINLARIHVSTKNFKKALPALKESNNIINQNIQDYFSFLSEEEKGKYVRSIAANYELYLSFLMKASSVSTEFCSLVYDNELLLKGLILSSVTAMQKAIIENGDSALKSQYEQMRMLKRQLNYWQQKPISEQRVDVNKLEKQSSEIEKELVQRSQIYSEMQATFKIKWKDVQKQLKDGEVSIEFVNFRYSDDEKITDSIFYCALVLRKDDTIPQLKYLCEESQLKKVIPPIGTVYREINSSYNGKDIYSLVWQPINSLLTGIKTIYFAPSGLLNRISMAAISCPDSVELLEKYKLIQLSSTRSLAIGGKQESIKTAVGDGGIVYDTDSLTMLSKAAQYAQKDSSFVAHRPEPNGDTRSGFRYLPGTLKEVDMIASKLEKNGVETKTISGSNAVEESFISLSGKESPSIIHLSTHGFYFSEINRSNNNTQNTPSTTGEMRFRSSSDPLLRSGLLMAGANRSWKGLSAPQDVEDGILTAKEVSNMNLMNTQLVVLSACQTGQGDVKGNEGVEGLQRGFKMAGARYIIMSLWAVPDKETTEFMGIFYDNWLDSKDIHAAFRNTQIAMSNKYKSDPFKWAAFVLVE